MARFMAFIFSGRFSPMSRIWFFFVTLTSDIGDTYSKQLFFLRFGVISGVSAQAVGVSSRECRWPRMATAKPYTDVLAGVSRELTPTGCAYFKARTTPLSY